MRLLEFLRERRWTPAVGYGLFVALLAAGYYNVTFVQLGLLDLGTRLVGMTEAQVSVWMAAFALLTFGVAVATDLLGRVPVVGTVVQFVLVATGLDAVLITYYGFREFEPSLADLQE